MGRRRSFSASPWIGWLKEANQVVCPRKVSHDGAADRVVAKDLPVGEKIRASGLSPRSARGTSAVLTIASGPVAAAIQLSAAANPSLTPAGGQGDCRQTSPLILVLLPAGHVEPGTMPG